MGETYAHIIPTTWPTLQQKLAILTLLGVTPFPRQLDAHSVLVGPRTIPATVCVLGGERAGKSQWAAAEIATLLPFSELIYLAGAEYENAQKEFRYLLQFVRQLGIIGDTTTGVPGSIVAMPKSGQWEMTVSPLPTRLVRIETISFAQKGADALIATGEAPDIILLAEAGMCEEDQFLAAYSRVSERRGAVILSGTLKRAKPWYVALYRELQGESAYNGRSFSFPSWQNTVVYPGGRGDRTIVALERALGEVRFKERIGAEPIASPLLVFAREFDRKLHVKVCAYDPSLPLWLVCDPGYAGAYALEVIQAAGKDDVRVIDEFYERYATWDMAVRWLRERDYVKCDSKGRVLNVRRAVMDVAGAQHHGDKSQAEQWWAATGIAWRGKKIGIEEGINRLRDFLRSPFDYTKSRLTIDPKCKGLIWELEEGEMYQRDGAGDPIRDTPLDANNHARKAVSYGVVEWFSRSDGRRVRGNDVGVDVFSVSGRVQEISMERAPGGRVIFKKRKKQAPEMVWE
jgi:hypothetical protein